MLVLTVALSRAPLSYFQIASIASGMAPLALAAMGQTIVVLARGFDLSAGATLSLTNVVVASHMGDTLASQILWSAIGLLLAWIPSRHTAPQQSLVKPASNETHIITDEFVSFIEDVMDKWRAPGLTLTIVKPGGDVEYAGFGISTEQGDPVTPDVCHIS